MAEACMFPLPKEHWLPHQGVKECMSCSSTFAKKTLFHSSKDNCRKCGRVVCKKCLKYKIKDVRNICAECYKSKDNNTNKNINAISISTKDLYAQYEDMKNNPYLSEYSLKQYQQQFNLQMPTHSGSTLSTASTVAVPHSLLDFTTDIPLPGTKAPSPHILSPLVKVDEEYDQKYEIPNQKRASFTREFRERKTSSHQRKSSQSVGNLSLSKSKSKSNASPKCITRKSITVIKWIDDEIFDIDEKSMKLLEDSCYSQTKINNTQAMIIRLDGYSFGIFTANMNKPFDKRFHSAMVYTACDLLKEFDAYTVFVQSDEIVLIYPTQHHKSKANYLFAGKIAKILSIVSSFAAIRFSHHLQREFMGGKDEHVQNCFASFNGKCFNVLDENEIFSYIIWRLKKNVRGYHKKILTVDNEFCHGTFVKKEKYVNQKKKKERERITSCCVEIESKNKKYYQLLSGKYWKNEFLQEMQNKSNNLKRKVVNKEDKMSFDDDDVYPDIYNTMIIHEGNTMKRIVKPVSNNQKKYNIVPKRQSLPIKRTRDITSIAAKFEAESKKAQIIQSQTPKQVNLHKKHEKNETIEEIAAKFETESRKQKISQTQAPKKQVIIHRKKEKKEKKEAIIAVFEAELKKQIIIEKKKEKKEKKEKREAIEIKNDIYDENNIYSTMIIHDINKNQKTANIIKVIKTNQKKSFFKPKKKAYHHNNNRIPTPKNAQKQKLNVPNTMISNVSNVNGKINKINNASKEKEKKKNKIVKPASSNPNYKYNYNITLNQANIAKKPQYKKDSPKAMSAKDRIREMNQRFQKLQQ